MSGNHHIAEAGVALAEIIDTLKRTKPPKSGTSRREIAEMQTSVGELWGVPTNSSAGYCVPVRLGLMECYTLLNAMMAFREAAPAATLNKLRKTIEYIVEGPETSDTQLEAVIEPVRHLRQRLMADGAAMADGKTRSLGSLDSRRIKALKLDLCRHEAFESVHNRNAHPKAKAAWWRALCLLEFAGWEPGMPLPAAYSPAQEVRAHKRLTALVRHDSVRRIKPLVRATFAKLAQAHSATVAALRRWFALLAHTTRVTIACHNAPWKKKGRTAFAATVPPRYCIAHPARNPSAPRSPDFGAIGTV